MLLRDLSFVGFFWGRGQEGELTEKGLQCKLVFHKNTILSETVTFELPLLCAHDVSGVQMNKCLVSHPVLRSCTILLLEAPS